MCMQALGNRARHRQGVSGVQHGSIGTTHINTQPRVRFWCQLSMICQKYAQSYAWLQRTVCHSENIQTSQPFQRHMHPTAWPMLGTIKEQRRKELGMGNQIFVFTNTLKKLQEDDIPGGRWKITLHEDNEANGPTHVRIGQSTQKTKQNWRGHKGTC